MKNLFLSGVLFFSFSVFAQSADRVLDLQERTGALAGSVAGFNVRNGDDKLDFGLVIPTLTKEQVMDFSLSYMLSAETSVIRAAGQRINVPSNLSLPRQSERYSFFNIRINKPEFKLPIATATLPPKVVVLEGSFPFANTVDSLRSGLPLFAVINSFDFKSYSQQSITNVDEPLALKVGENTVDGAALEFVSPLGEDDEFVTLGLSMASQNTFTEDVTRYFPIDVKTLELPQLLKTDSLSDTTPIVVAIPKTVFESASDASQKPFPFTMVWGESAPALSLPLAKDFVTLSVDQLQYDVDFTKINMVSVLAMKATFLDADKSEISSSISIGNFQAQIKVPVPEGAVRSRIDVYAIDVDPVKVSILLESGLSAADILREAKYITRYEEDLNQ